MKRGKLPNDRGVITDEELADLAERNRARTEEAIAQLGCRYVLHPANAPQKKSHANA